MRLQKTYPYRGRQLTLAELSQKAGAGVTPRLIQDRLYAGKTVEEAVHTPFGGGAARNLRRRSSEEALRARGHKDWRQVRCPRCGARPGKKCRGVRSKARKIPHSERRGVARIEQDDRHLVPKDWRERIDLIHQERLAQWDAEEDMRKRVVELRQRGFKNPGIATRLGITLWKLQEVLNGPSRQRGPKLWSGTALARPPHQTEGHGEIGLPHSMQRCGGGWRASRSPRVDDGHHGLDHSRELEKQEGER